MNIQNFKEFKSLRESLKISLSEKSVLRYLTDEQIEESLQLSFTNQDQLLEFKLLGWLKDKAEAAGSWLADAAKNVFSSVKNMVVSIKTTIIDFLKKAWLWIKNSVTKELDKSKGKVQHKIEQHLESHKSIKTKLREEVKLFKDSIQYLIQYFSVGITMSLEKDLEKIADEEINASDEKDNPKEIENLENNVEKALEESLNEICIEILSEAIKDNPEEFSKSLNESAVGGHVPFLSTIGHKLAHYPPFSWLHNVKDWATNAANSFADKLSNLSAKLGGAGPYEFLILGGVIGLVTEYIVEQSAVLGIKELAHKFAHTAFGESIILAFPALGITLKVLKYVATGLWIVGVVEVALQL